MQKPIWTGLQQTVCIRSFVLWATLPNNLASTSCYLARHCGTWLTRQVQFLPGLKGRMQRITSDTHVEVLCSFLTMNAKVCTFHLHSCRMQRSEKECVPASYQLESRKCCHATRAAAQHQSPSLSMARPAFLTKTRFLSSGF